MTDVYVVEDDGEELLPLETTPYVLIRAYDDGDGISLKLDAGGGLMTAELVKKLVRLTHEKLEKS